MHHGNEERIIGRGAGKPNILVIWGDDIGMWNVGAYTHGMMGHTTNIDSIARDGMLFTDHYRQPSCTAGRAAFLMGQLPIRTGMTTVGIPGSTRGIQASNRRSDQTTARSSSEPSSLFAGSAAGARFFLLALPSAVARACSCWRWKMGQSSSM